MLTAQKIKVLQSLDKKKFRQKYNLFLVEGNKMIRELKKNKFPVQEIFSVDPEYLMDEGFGSVNKISQQELNKISFLKTPKDSVAVCEIPESIVLENKNIQLILDGIQDPGNLGTLIRLADWFGIAQIICSEDTADFYNPKVIQASMGSFLRVNVVYRDIKSYLESSTEIVLGTDMEGCNLYQEHFPEKFSLVLGSEGNGIRADIKKMITKNIMIPRFSQHQSTESLNVSMAAGIILGQIFAKRNP